MKKLLSTCAIISALSISANAFEFGYMGNRSFGMGGAGVGIANSAWGLYYNPALQGVDNRFKVGYSFGARVKEHGLSEIKNFNLGAISKDSINTINSLLGDNEVALTSENGLVLQVPLTVSARLSHSIGVGLFYTKRSAVNFTGYVNNGGTTTDISNATNAFMVTNTLDTLEIPLSYTMQVYTGGFGTFHAGIALKYIYAGHSSSKIKLTKDTNIANPFSDIFKSPTGARTNTAGIDIGLAYALPNEWLVIGIVGKNLNSPVLKAQLLDTNGKPANNDKLKMDAQYRLGISTRAIPMTTLAMDFDLKPNYEFGGFNTKVDSTAKSVIRRQVQYISFGAMLNAGLLDLRLGASKDIKEKNANDGWLFSAGVGFGYLDFAFFTGTKMSKAVKNIPQEFGFKLGGSFSF